MSFQTNATGLILATTIAMTSLASAAYSQQSADGLKLDIYGGYSHLILGSTDFTAEVNFLNTETLGNIEDHDGRHNGGRLDVSLGGIRVGRVNGVDTTLAVNGFYGAYNSKQNAECNVVNGVKDCVVFPLFDPNTGGAVPASPNKGGGATTPTSSGEDFSGGLFSEWKTQTDRDVSHWGIAVEARLNKAATDYRNGNRPVALSPVEWRLGAAFKRIDQDSHYYAVDYGPLLDPVTLNEDLETSYAGAYLGFQSRHPLDGGLTFVLNGEGGIYHASTRYSAAYNATDTFGGPGQPISQTLSLKDDNVAFIGKLGMELEREFDIATIALFGMTEFYSHAPDVKYNNYERNGGGVLDLTGPQDGTVLGTTTAYSYTLGMRVTVPFQ